MVTESFLCRLPQMLDAQQRILLEGIGIAVDVIEIAFDTMHALGAEALQRRDGERVEFTHGERLRMMAAAWSIVDQAHNTRRLLTAAGKKIDLASAREFLRAGTVATVLRNKLDHLADNLKNRAANKTPMPPIFGAISLYTFFDDNRDELASSPGKVPINGYRVAMVFASAVQGSFRAQAGAAQSVAEISLPCDHFCLQAFGETLNLTEVRDAARALRDDLSVHVEKACIKEAEAIAKREGKPIEELLAPVIGATTLVLRADFPQGSRAVDDPADWHQSRGVGASTRT